MSDSNSNQRESELADWALKQLVKLRLCSDSELKISKASDDASFRRYFRAATGNESYILMDAPPHLENSLPFVEVGRLLFDHKVNVPRIYAVDLELGFMLLSDFGPTLYLDELGNPNSDQSRKDQLYEDALDALLRVQKVPASDSLPLYDRDLLLREMHLFTQWFLPQLLEMEIDTAESALLNDTFDILVENALNQPQVLVHRDYHSRNLMVLSADSDGINPGILDFQDAVVGPVTYDLVALLRDCYVSWPDDYVYTRVQDYRSRMQDAGLIKHTSKAEFERWFDLMGMQRHIKCAGIFSRLKLRDGKERYLQDIPLVMSYIHSVAGKYEELNQFFEWLNRCVVDPMKAKGLVLK